MRLVLATHNAKKLAELRRIVAAAQADAQATGLDVAGLDVAGLDVAGLDVAGLDIVGLDEVASYPEPVESGRTFTDNALMKARACHRATGLPALADDSGLAVDELNGMPGVRSARWSGPDATDASNNELLLRQLFDLPPDRRRAWFVCAMAFVAPDGSEEVRVADMPGRLLYGPRGENGFGYDPLFVADQHTQTNAELPPEAKDAISHRGQAIRAIVPVVLAHLAGGERSSGSSGTSQSSEGAHR